MSKFLFPFVLLLFSSCTKQETNFENKKLKINSADQIKSSEAGLSKDEIQEVDIKTIMYLNDTIKSVPEKFKKFIPKNYSIIKISKGDLNLDGLEDNIIVVAKKSEENMSDFENGKPEKRRIILLVNTGNNLFKAVKKSDNIISCIDCEVNQDAFIDIKIKNGFFTIESGIAGGQHWQIFTTFKYNKTKNNWFLNRVRGISYTMNKGNGLKFDEDYGLYIEYDGTKTVKNFGTVAFEDYNYYNENSKY